MVAIKNTQYEQAFPWPTSMLVQGGSRGLVFNRTTGSSYETAFVEAFPENGFLRGEGPDVPAAEQACWEKYLLFVYCVDKSKKHGPFESRGYENGSGFCTRCGLWFESNIAGLPESDRAAQERKDFNECTLEVLAEEKWPPNQVQFEIVRRMKHRVAVREAVAEGVEPPEFDIKEPVDEEELDKDTSAEIARLLESMAGARRLGDPDSEVT